VTESAGLSHSGSTMLVNPSFLESAEQRYDRVTGCGGNRGRDRAAATRASLELNRGGPRRRRLVTKSDKAASPTHRVVDRKRLFEIKGVRA
jgi:hypothetical protein